MIQSVGVDCPTCRAEERASLETTKCVIERPTLVSAKCAEEILAGKTYNMCGRQLGCCRGRLLKKAANEAAGETKPEAYPLGRTVRRIRSTTSVRAAEW
jgi:hypothetical protein